MKAIRTGTTLPAEVAHGKRFLKRSRIAVFAVTGNARSKAKLTG
jgi:hypothetical protein